MSLLNFSVGEKVIFWRDRCYPVVALIIDISDSHPKFPSRIMFRVRISGQVDYWCNDQELMKFVPAMEPEN